jgi:hypothetical protein
MTTDMTFRRHRHRAPSLALLALLCGLTGGGCGGSGAPYAESSKTEATVTGRVTSQGKPVTKGQVIFDPANINRSTEAARMAEIRKDGSYEVTTLIGENRVTLAIPARPKKKVGTPHFQKVYNVKSEGNTLDIEAP